MKKSFHFFFIHISFERICFLFYTNNISWHFFCSKIYEKNSLARALIYVQENAQFVVHKS